MKRASIVCILALSLLLLAARAGTRATIRDCPDCPEMEVIPAGTFTMGSSAQERAWAATHGGNAASVADESPQHQVTLRAFAIGKYDVTRGEFAVFVRDAGYSPEAGCGHDGTSWKKLTSATWKEPGFAQTDRDPVVCVSWHDAQAYIVWLNGKARSAAPKVSGAQYRLPTESEWEYATRGGTTTMFWWGDDAGQTAAHAWYKENSGETTHPVGSKPANPFGLYDAVGNVWQWTQDCYADDYANAPADGGAAEAKPADCMRVDRGGSWFYPAWLLRSAPRERNPPGYRDLMLGFRVAKSLP